MDTPINDRDAYGQTALHYAVCHQEALPLVTILAESCAQLDPDRQGRAFRETSGKPRA